MNLNKNQNKQRQVLLNRRPSLNKYYSSRPANPDSPFVRKQPPKSVKKFFFGFLDLVLIFLLIGLLIYSLIISSSPTLTVNNTDFHSINDYRAAATAELSHLSNRNKITFNENAVSSDLKKQFPEIDNISIELPVFSEQPRISLSIANPAFKISGQGGVYVVNSAGIAVPIPAGVKNSRLQTVEDKSGFTTRPGAKVLTDRAVSFIAAVIAQCQESHLTISSIVLPAAPEEMQLRISDQPYYIKFFLGGDVTSQIGQFLAARQQFIKTGQTPSQYLDVRINGKVFYK